MDVANRIDEVRQRVKARRLEGRTIGLVPTMGALHAGHRSLVEMARRDCGYVVVSIFVNPTQFGPSEDYGSYPRTLGPDLAACEEDGVDLVFHPPVEEMYPADPSCTTVHVSGLSEHLCGAHRPGHFDGVTTVVAKLFNIVRPDRAYFGEKDYQQLQVIRRMVADLNMPVAIVPGPTVREADGVALSSRNAYLSAEERRQAAALNRSLREAAEAARAGERDTARLRGLIERRLRESGPIEIDYVEIVHPETLAELPEIGSSARLCLAVRIGKCRLIDNLAIEAPAVPT